jgi:hypothetical protein
MLVILAGSSETLDRFATQVGPARMGAHIVALPASPPDRQLGPITTSRQYL